MSELEAGSNGEPAICQECHSPIVLYKTETQYEITCSCPETTIDLADTTVRKTPFDPISGKWSQVDDADVTLDYD